MTEEQNKLAEEIANWRDCCPDYVVTREWRHKLCDLALQALREPATEAVLEMALTRMDRAREILRGPNANWGMLDTSDLRAALKGKGASQGADMSGLDYDALWHKAKEEARRRAEAMYPPEASHDRAIAEIEIAQRLYRQFTMPPKEMP